MPTHVCIPCPNPKCSDTGLSRSNSLLLLKTYSSRLAEAKSIITREFLGMTVPSTSTSSDTTRAKERIGDPSRIASDMALFPNSGRLQSNPH